jgi:hypothetical protein
VAELGENRVAVLNAQTLGHVGGHGQCGKPLAKNNRTPDHLHVNEAAVLAPLTPNDVAIRGIQRNGLGRAVFFRRTNVRKGLGQKFFTRITVMLNGRFVDFQKRLGFEIEHPHRIRIAVKEEAVLFFTIAQFLLYAQAIRHVAAIGHETAYFRV